MRLLTLVVVGGLCASCTHPNASTAAPATPVQPRVDSHAFGARPDGSTIEEFTLANAHGAVAKVITYGAIVADLQLPNADGTRTSVIKPATYSLENAKRSFPQSAAVIGRVGNRIAHARFTLDGTEYVLAANTPPHHLHGGRVGFDKVLWRAEPLSRKDGPAVRLRYTSVDGEEGYPGTLNVTVDYTLTDTNTLRIEYTATTDKPTLFNPTNHAYFNLSGAGNIADAKLTIEADRYTAADRMNVPTGELHSVAGTPLDFRQPTTLGARPDGLADRGYHYDHNFVLNGANGNLRLAARLEDAKARRTMEVWIIEPGLQVYTPFAVNAPLPQGRTGYVCLETQHFPDAIHHPEFPSVVLRPGQTFRSVTEYRFP